MRIALQRSEETRGEFSVYWWDPDGGQNTELRFVDAGRAMNRAASLARGPAAQMGIVERIIVTDGGDFINFEWLKGQGVTYPPEHRGKR
jgi:hypothetical protein